MPILKFAPGSQLRRAQANGLIAIEASGITGIERAILPAHSIFLVETYVRSRERWEGDRMPERDWLPGSVAFLPGGSEIQSIPRHPYSETVISIERADLVKTARDYVESVNYSVRFADVTGPDTTSIAQMLQRLIASGESDAWPLLTDSLVLALSASIVRTLTPREAAAADAKVIRLAKGRHKRVIDFVEANIGNRIRLEAMADAAALSPFHFSRAFKQATGLSPSKYVLDRRIREAKMLLKSTSKSLAEIALMCGFASQSHFATAFKAAVGVTPRFFRTSHGLIALMFATVAGVLEGPMLV